MTLSQVCVDSSFVLKLVIPEAGSVRVERLWNEWAAQSREIVAPFLLWYEVTSALRKLAHRGVLTLDEARGALATLLRLRVTTVAPPALHETALELATTLNQPAAYDAHYLAVALTLGCPFWTADRSLYDAAMRVVPEIHLVG